MSLSPYWEALEAELPGQSKAVRVLAAIVEHRALAHAYVFAGPSGAGKLRAAVAFAVAENCDDHGCMTCALCKSVDAMIGDPPKSVHPDISVVRPERRDYPIDQIRELRRGLYQRPVELATRFIILVGADRMQPPSANALLKALEEPPENACWVLVADRWDSLLPTVRSRCQLIQFRPVHESVLADRLADEAKGDRALALAATHAAGGRPETARKLMSSQAFARALTLVDTLVEDLDHRDVHQLLSDADELVKAIEDVGHAIGADTERDAAKRGDDAPEAVRFTEKNIDEFAVDGSHASRLRAFVRDRRKGGELVARAEGASVVLGLMALAYRDLLCAAVGAEDVLADPAAVARRAPILKSIGAGGAAGALDAIAQARSRLWGNVKPANAVAAMLLRIAEETRWHKRSA